MANLFVPMTIVETFALLLSLNFLPATIDLQQVSPLPEQMTYIPIAAREYSTLNLLIYIDGNRSASYDEGEEAKELLVSLSIDDKRVYRLTDADGRVQFWISGNGWKLEYCEEEIRINADLNTLYGLLILRCR